MAICRDVAGLFIIIMHDVHAFREAFSEHDAFSSLVLQSSSPFVNPAFPEFLGDSAAVISLESSFRIAIFSGK